MAHTYDVRYALGTLLTGVADAESDGRGYALTGDGASLASCAQARSRAVADVARLRALTADDPQQEQDLARLAPQLDRIFAALQAAVDARQRAGLDAAAAATHAGGDEEDAQAIRASIAAMGADEQRLLTQRSARPCSGRD